MTTTVRLSLTRTVTYLGVPPAIAGFELALALALTNLAGGTLRGFLLAVAATAALHLAIAAATRRDPLLLFAVVRCLRHRDFYEALPRAAASPRRRRAAARRF